MATTTARMNTQLTTGKQTQTDTAIPTLETRKLARLLKSAIHYHYYGKEFFDTLAKGADIDFIGIDDRNQNVNPPLIDTILYYNTLAFEELLKRGADINKASKGDFVPLFHAVSHGNLRIVRALIARGADPLDYRQGSTCLSVALECIKSGTLLEPQSRWRYENESPDTNNTVLKQQISDFFLQEGVYTPPKPNQAIPFVAPDHAIHVYSQGNLDIIGFLLNRQVSPTIAVSETDRSPLAIVQNPTKYFDVFDAEPDEQLKYIGTETENPNTLLFTMTLVNKRSTGTIPSIVVHYDLEPARKLIEGAVAHLNPHTLAVTASLSREMQETGEKLNAQLTEVQRRLSDARCKTEQVEQEVKYVKEAVHYDERQEIAEFNLLINGHPNAQEAYQRFKIGLEAIHTSALAVKGGGVTVSQGPAALVASVLDMSKELVDMIPIVGSAASKLFGLASKVATEADHVRQTNLFKNIADMATAKEARKIFESVARKLTMAYLLQFERLATKQTAQEQMSRTQQSLQTAKGKMLNSRFKSPAEQVTAFAIIWMMEEVFNNAHTDTLAKEIAEKGLETVLLNVVTQRRPPEKLTAFWNEITSKLGINAIPTQSVSGTTSGETWHPADFWTAPGVVVENASGSQYFTGNNTNVAKFGYRLGSIEDVQALGLTPTTETAVLPQSSAPTKPSTPTIKSSANDTLNVELAPSPMAYAYPNAPKPAPFNAASTSCEPVVSVSPPPYESKEPTQDNPPAPKRNRSPFGRLRACLKTS
jgi:hypothetical protein